MDERLVAINEAKAFIEEALSGRKPQVGIVLGSGLGKLADKIESPVVIKYSNIPHFVKSTAIGHKGNFIAGMLGGKFVIAMQGRFHFYEGYPMEKVVLPIRVMVKLGIEALFVSNAAGGVNYDYKVGDLMIIKDHINLLPNPLIGPNLEEFGPRFFDITNMYTPALRKLAWDCAEGIDLTVHEGNYYFFTGPQFETPAEIRAVRILGADAVGMSTVTEALTAAHCGMPLLCLSVMTNMAAGVLDQPLTNEEVDETGKTIATRFGKYVTKIVSRIGEVEL